MEKELLTTKVLSALPGALLPWYRACARDLPWRRTDDPYRIWISEIMLQQTRVAAVLGYYARFLAAFPTVESLAAAPEDRLMKCWEGLGYYSRARNLQRAARVVAERYGGRLPASYEALLALPGIGDYTASAIASAAFGLPCPAVDGNVLRVTARLTDCAADVTAPATKRAVRSAVGAVMPPLAADVRVFNQALMELGAVVCVPNGKPRCGACPMAEACLGRSRGTAERLPVRAPRRARRVEERTVFLLLRGGRAALRRRDGSGLLAGLWEFPGAEGSLDASAAARWVRERELRVLCWERRLCAKHIFTHVEWHMSIYVLRVEGDGPDDFFWADRAALAQRSLPSAFARCRDAAEKFLEQEERL